MDRHLFVVHKRYAREHNIKDPETCVAAAASGLLGGTTFSGI